MVGHEGKVFIPIAGSLLHSCSAEHLELMLNLWNMAGWVKALDGVSEPHRTSGAFHAAKQPPSWPLLSRDAEGFPLGRAAGRCSCTVGFLFSCPGGSLLLPAPSCKAGQNLRSSSQMEQKN